MVEGKIVKAHRGLYYVKTDKVIKCKARGLFRRQNLVPVVGDDVEIRLSKEDNSGYIEKICPRKNALLRPYVANVDLVVIVMSLKNPKISLILLDRFLLMCKKSGVETIICINKSDLLIQVEKNKMQDIYRNTDYKIFFTNIFEKETVNPLIELTLGKTTVFAGPSGVGKSSLLNLMTFDTWKLETGMISDKTKRGKHTTRHVELFPGKFNTFFLDTPGFSSLNLNFLEHEDEIKFFMPDFQDYKKICKFQDCNHIQEPVCGIKKAVEDKHISNERYENYLTIYNEVKSMRRY